MSSHISLHEFSKTYKKLKKNNIYTHDIDDTLDKLNFYLNKRLQQSHPNDNITELSRDEYIESKLRETLCICSILFGVEYDLQISSD